MKKKPITEIILAVVLVVSLAAFFLLKDTGSGTQSHGESVGQESNTTENQDGMSDYEKYHLLMNADAEDEKTEKRLYIYSMSINKETYFKYQVKHVNQIVKYCWYYDTPGVKKSICGTYQFKVTQVQKLDHYDMDAQTDEKIKYIKVSFEAMNEAEQSYIWSVNAPKLAIMDEIGLIHIQNHDGYCKEIEYDGEPEFYTRIRGTDDYEPADYNTGQVLLHPGQVLSYSLIYAVGEECIDDENLVVGDMASIKPARVGEAAEYNNIGYRIYLNK